MISSFEAGNNTKLDSVPELLRNNSKEVIANFLEKYVYNITKHFFDFEDTQEFCLFAPMSTYYDKGCRFSVHHDAITTNLCSIIIYLNKQSLLLYIPVFITNGILYEETITKVITKFTIYC